MMTIEVINICIKDLCYICFKQITIFEVYHVYCTAFHAISLAHPPCQEVLSVSGLVMKGHIQYVQ